MTIRWIADGELHNAQTHNRPLMDYIQNELSSLARKTTMIHTSTGVSGGGSLENDISINGVAATETSIGMIQLDRKSVV